MVTVVVMTGVATLGIIAGASPSGTGPPRASAEAQPADPGASDPAPPAGAPASARAGDQAGEAPANREEAGEGLLAAPPPTFMIAPFDNRTDIAGLYWLRAAAPFLLAERAEQVLALRLAPGQPPWLLPHERRSPADAAAVAARATAAGADWMWTGWLAGHRGALELSVQLWRVVEGEAEPVGTTVRHGPQEQIFRMLGEAALELAAVAGLDADADAAQTMSAAPTSDFYAFTLFGRGLADLAGISPGGWVTWRSERSRLQRAKRHMARAVNIAPRFAPAQRVLGEVQRALGENDAARARIESALRLDPGYLQALTARAVLAREDGEPGRAETLYRAYLAQRPWDMQRRYDLGRMLWANDRMEAARVELSRVVAQDEDHLDARRILVRIHARRGETDALIRELEALLQRDATDAANRFDLAAAYMAKGRVADAVRLYESLTKSPDASAQAYKFLGDLYRRRGDTDRARRFYSRALEAAPDDPRPYFLLGALHLEAGDEAAAEDVFRHAQRFKSYASRVHNNLGAIAYHHGKHGEAIWYLRRAVWMRPRSARYRYNLALALSATGDLTGALVEIRAGLGGAPEHAGLHYLRGVVRLRQGKHDEARTSFENTLRLAPDHADARYNLVRLERMRREAPAEAAAETSAAPQ